MKQKLINWLVFGIAGLFIFAINGWVLTWTLPEFHTLYVGLLSIIQWIFVAAAGLVLTGLSALTALLVIKIIKTSEAR